jgi:hypothetical protein
MTFMDKLGAGLEQAAREVEQALDRGKGKVGELQIEMQMDRLAKRLGYLVFDFYRGRPVDQAARQNVLDELSRLEDQLWKMRADAAAKAEADAQARAARRTDPHGQEDSSGKQSSWGETASPTSDWDPGMSTQQPGGEGQPPSA